MWTKKRGIPRRVSVQQMTNFETFVYWQMYGSVCVTLANSSKSIILCIRIETRENFYFHLSIQFWRKYYVRDVSDITLYRIAWATSNSGNRIYTICERSDRWLMRWGIERASRRWQTQTENEVANELNDLFTGKSTKWTNLGSFEHPKWNQMCLVRPIDVPSLSVVPSSFCM